MNVIRKALTRAEAEVLLDEIRPLLTWLGLTNLRVLPLLIASTYCGIYADSGDSIGTLVCSANGTNVTLWPSNDPLHAFTLPEAKALYALATGNTLATGRRL